MSRLYPSRKKVVISFHSAGSHHNGHSLSSGDSPKDPQKVPDINDLTSFPPLPFLKMKFSIWQNRVEEDDTLSQASEEYGDAEIIPVWIR
ncbi:hypothetical protein [Coxiella burnetii]|uniref:hypothetical protein n=1 Tax=Coxiella burnetii TaxID=777 RepID=UPI0001632654|nr:hypothetical protein [Coxiella burnetii]AIT63455.1 hypothetical protein CBNA_1194 [Coxiella burnetii str. Namibia]AML48801.1 hypothetical protein AUR58_06150 [Coxiella burnetii]AML54765.1 hypothetical protein AYM38_05445 [Coxiella burnetii]APQ67063.1 hypothetical protein A35_06105 [Coxiella burnetii 'MSU Goat Q177']ARI66124.1 hypothetical protein B7L74_06890 [Coxiella burnetii]